MARDLAVPDKSTPTTLKKCVTAEAPRAIFRQRSPALYLVFSWAWASINSCKSAASVGSAATIALFLPHPVTADFLVILTLAVAFWEGRIPGNLAAGHFRNFCGGSARRCCLWCAVVIAFRYRRTSGSPAARTQTRGQYRPPV
jgi:hypothetical protein